MLDSYFPTEAGKLRAFFADTLNLPSADAGGGWLISALPSAELPFIPRKVTDATGVPHPPAPASIAAILTMRIARPLS
jgi:hypothetical protein